MGIHEPAQDRAPGYLEDLGEVLDGVERMLTQLEDRLRPVSVQLPERAMVDGPLPAPDNVMHGHLITARRISNRVSTMLQEIRL